MAPEYRYKILEVFTPKNGRKFRPVQRAPYSGYFFTSWGGDVIEFSTLEKAYKFLSKQVRADGARYGEVILNEIELDFYH